MTCNGNQTEDPGSGLGSNSLTVAGFANHLALLDFAVSTWKIEGFI